MVVASALSDVEAALDRLGEARTQGFYAAGYFSHELSYALEPKLAALMPASPDLPLLWFGLFRPRRDRDSAGLAALIAASAAGRVYAEPLHFSETREDYGRQIRPRAGRHAGDAYQVTTSNAANVTKRC